MKWVGSEWDKTNNYLFFYHFFDTIFNKPVNEKNVIILFESSLNQTNPTPIPCHRINRKMNYKF